MEIFSFNGRATRREYIKVSVIMLFVVLVILLFLFREFFLLISSLSSLILKHATSYSGLSMLLFVVNIIIGALLIVVVPLLLRLPVTVRRLHDLNMSGYWVVLCVIPFFAFWIDSICNVREGTKGGNRFGPDPLTRKSK